MKNQDYTRLSIDVPNETHQALKFLTATKHIKIKDYVLELIEEDLSEELEDYLLGQMALKAVKEGALGEKKSEQFLKKLRDSLQKDKIRQVSKVKKSTKK